MNIQTRSTTVSQRIISVVMLCTYLMVCYMMSFVGELLALKVRGKKADKGEKK